MVLDLVLKHSAKNRVRYKIKNISDKGIYGRIESDLKSLSGIISVRINRKCRSVIINYDSNNMRLNDIESAIKGPDSSVSENKLTKSEINPVKKHGIRFGLLSTAISSVFFRKVILKKVVAQSIFSPLGIVTALFAIPQVLDGLKGLKKRQLDLDGFLGAGVVMSIAAGESIAALEILWITSGGELLKSWISERSRNSIRRILDITSKNSYILVDGVEVEVPVERIRKGDTVVLHAGEKISVDGPVIKGEGLIDESPVNGRSEHIFKKTGDKVFAGTFVSQGVIFVEAEEVGDKTYLSRVLSMVENSLENKSEIELSADRLAKRLVKIGLVSTLGTFILTRSAWNAFTVMLVMSCPCATILAASTAVSAAINRSARKNILIKGGRYLEESGKANVICFDKTGTLTTGMPVIRKFKNFSDLSEDTILKFVVSAEIHNFHPVALAIKNESERRGIETIPHDLCEYIIGKGVISKIGDKEILVGSRQLMKDYDVDISIAEESSEKYKKMGLTRVYASIDGKLAALFAFANKEKEDVEKVVEYLRHNRTEKIVIITGDDKYSAEYLSNKLKADQCFSSVLPEEKSAIVKSLRKNGDKVIMVGDGINDALALAEADIGIAMGTGGSEIAIEAADIALVRDDLKDLIFIRKISQHSNKIIKQNFWIATGTNIGGAALGFAGLLNPFYAGVIHILHTLGVLINSSRLLYFDIDPIEENKK